MSGYGTVIDIEKIDIIVRFRRLFINAIKLLIYNVAEPEDMCMLVSGGCKN